MMRVSSFVHIFLSSSPSLEAMMPSFLSKREILGRERATLPLLFSSLEVASSVFMFLDASWRPHGGCSPLQPSTALLSRTKNIKVWHIKCNLSHTERDVGNERGKRREKEEDASEEKTQERRDERDMRIGIVSHV